MAEKSFRSQPKKKPAKKTSKKGPGAKKTAGKTTGKSGAPEGQLSVLVSKSIDLAEAGLSLGLNLVQKLGGSLQHDIVDKFTRAKNAFMDTGGAQEPDGEYAESRSGHGGEPAHSAHFSGVINRLPLFPGSPVQVSFSINNDTPDQPKKVTLRLTRLTGELTREQLPSSACAIKPESSVIAPMDFEKFVVSGMIPVDTKADAYNGFIDVSGQEELRIPVRLIVTSRD